MTLNTSLVLSGDGEGAERAVRGVTDELAKGEKGAEAYNRAYAATEASIKKLSVAQAAASRETAQAKAQYAAGEITLEQYNRELLQTKTRLGLVQAQHRETASALRQANAALDASTGPTRQARAGYMQLGAQMQDVATMAMMPGTNIGQIIAMQGGQVASAVQMMGGRLSGLAGFIAGPYGAAILVATSLGANFIQTLWETDDAAGAAASGAEDYGLSLNVLADDLDTAAASARQLANDLRAAIIVQGDFVRAQAAMARQERQTAEDQIAENQRWLNRYNRENSGFGATILPQFFGPSLSDDREAARRRRENERLRKELRDPENPAEGLVAADIAGRRAVLQRNSLEALDPVLKLENEYKEKIGALSRQLDESTRNADDPLFAATGGNYLSEADYERQVRELTRDKDAAVEALRETQKTGREKRDRGGRSSIDKEARELQRLTEWGERAEEQIARISERFGEQPTLVVQVNQATRELDDTIAELAERKPPGFAEMIGDAVRAKDVVREALVRPFTELREESERRQQIDRMLLAGKHEEAAVVQEIWRMEQQLGPLNREQREEIEEIVQAEQEHLYVLEKAQALQLDYLDTTRSVRSEIEAGLAGRGDLGNFQQMFRDLKARVMVEQIFGPAFEELEEYVTENTALPDAVDVLTSETGRAGAAATSLADVLVNEARRIADPVAAASGPSPRFRAAFDGYGTTPEAANDNIVVVTAPDRPDQLSPEQYFEKMAQTVTGPILDGLDETFGVEFFGQLQGAVASAFYGYATAGTTGGVLGFANGLIDDFGFDLLGPDVGKAVSQGLSDALGGAQRGSQVAALGGMFGLNLSGGGAQLGGAIGSFLPIPGGDLIGAIAGGLFGSLFGGSKYGTATLTGAGDPNVRGKGDGRSEGASALGGSVQEALSRIAEALGADIGGYRVSIGTYKDQYRVSTTGFSGKLNFAGESANGLHAFDDQAAAIAFAISDALADGAITGVSAAVQKALRSSSNIEDAIEEALAVAELEELLLGASEAWREELRQFEETAQERVDLARRYGLDLVKVEEINAEQRLKLTEQLLEDQVGSLQDLIEQMTSGNLFEGSAVDRRDALLGDIADARAAAEAGEEGAADRLAQLLRQLNEVSAEVFGSTGGFAADRSLILDTARTVIADANRRIEEAKASDPALAETNAALDENNDQNAEIIELLKRIEGGGRKGGRPTVPPMPIDDLRNFARTG